MRRSTPRTLASPVLFVLLTTALVTAAARAAPLTATAPVEISPVNLLAGCPPDGRERLLGHDQVSRIGHDPLRHVIAAVGLVVVVIVPRGRVA
jgi:hypothetical protein